MTDYSVKRGYRGNVLVAPPGEEPVDGEWRVSKDHKRYFWSPRKLDYYGRTSKAGENLKGGGEGLANWKACMAAIGVIMNDSARSQIVSLINEFSGDPYYLGDDDRGSHSGKARLLDAVELACEVAGSSTASSRGTEFHKLGELVNQGQEPTVVQPYLAPHLNHYRDRVRSIRFLAQEILIVNDDIKRAGSIDYLMELPAGCRTPDGITHDAPLVVAGDLKTGKWDIDYPGGVSAQLAGYGLGFRYNQATNERLPIHDRCSDRWAVIVHYPIATPGATVQFYWVDMQVGLEAAKLNNRLNEMINYYKSEKGKPIRFEPTI